jgi:hypothetical protein
MGWRIGYYCRLSITGVEKMASNQS